MEVLVVHPFPSPSQNTKWHFGEVRACALWHIAKCDMVSVVLICENVDDHPKSWIWNGSDTNNIIPIHKPNILPLVFVICHRWCWFWHIGFENLELGWAFGFGGIRKCDSGMRNVSIPESMHHGENASLCCNWNSMSSSVNTSSSTILVQIYTGHVLGTVGQFNTYFFVVPLTQRLMSWRQHRNSYPTLLAEWNFFFIPLYVKARVPCLLFMTLALHQSLCVDMHCPTSFRRVRW